jgi:uncharacterized protein (DUF885 family)
VLTADPCERFVYENEALAFHESVPGHHLQVASVQTLNYLPAYRRFLDTDVYGYVECWGLYSERLADEMGLYTSDLARLGMLSFDALRACRLVVGTGIHHRGWSRGRAMKFKWDNTAATCANVRNEIDRYTAWPAQTLGYMIGRREIRRLRAQAEDRLGAQFDIRAFHGTVLGNGAVPLDVLGQIVADWIDSTVASSAIRDPGNETSRSDRSQITTRDGQVLALPQHWQPGSLGSVCRDRLGLGRPRGHQGSRLQ